MTAHATFSASGSKRWLNCPGSIKLSLEAPKGSSSVFAREGTAAHHLAETCLGAFITDASVYEGDIITVVEGEEPKQWQLESSGDVVIEGRDFVVSSDMVEAVNVYLAEIEYLRRESPHAEEFIEARVDLSSIRPGMFGTADYVRADFIDRILYVVDYKHGKGVLVDVEDNPQLKYYGLGAAIMCGMDMFDEVVLTVVQPRCPSEAGGVRTWTCSMNHLRKFAEELAAGYDRANEEDPILSAGEHCKFCPALGRPGLCTESERRVQEAAVIEFANMPVDFPENGSDSITEIPLPDTEEQLQKALHYIPLIDAWVKAVKGHAEARAKAGNPPRGYKLVEKRANRKWNDFTTDEERLELLQKDFELAPEACLHPPKFLSPAQIEKLIPSKKRKELTDKGYIIKPRGSLTLVHESDPRDAVQQIGMSAESEFGAYEPEE